MSVYSLECNKCGHIFYDITVLCSGQDVDKECPVCGSLDTELDKVKKPEGKIWAEDFGCSHGDPEKFLHGNLKEGKKERGACGSHGGVCSCDSKTEDQDLSLDELMDKRIEQNNKPLNTFVLPKKLRKKLSEPWGKIIQEVPIMKRDFPIITIGDVTTKAFLKKTVVPNVAIIDHRVNRKALMKTEYINEEMFSTSYFIPNPEGQLTGRLCQVVSRIDYTNLRRNILIQVQGEEDLATLICILNAPIGSNLFYGQPDQGMCHIVLDKEIKYKAEDIFAQFDLLKGNDN